MKAKYSPEDMGFRFDGFVYVASIHMYTRYICTSSLPKSKFSGESFQVLKEPREGRKLSANYQRRWLLAGRSDARLLATNLRLDRVFRDGRRCPIVKFQAFYLQRSTDRRMRGWNRRRKYNPSPWDLCKDNAILKHRIVCRIIKEYWLCHILRLS